MRLAKVTLRNFRCYRGDFSICLGDLTTLIGKNESGKSTIFDALNLYKEFLDLTLTENYLRRVKISALKANLMWFLRGFPGARTYRREISQIQNILELPLGKRFGL